MYLVGSFDLNGVMRSPRDFFTVKKECGVLVIRFANNAILPLELRTVSPCTYEVWCCNAKVFNLPVSNSDILSVKRRTPVNAEMISVTLSVFGSGIPELSTAIDVYASGKVLMYPYRTRCGCVKEVIRTDEDMREWFTSLGVVKPIGCSYVEDYPWCTDGVTIENTYTSIIIGFPNGLKFPVIWKNNGWFIVGSNVVLSHTLSNTWFVNVTEITSDSVVFDVIFEDGWQTIISSGIRYNREYVEFDGVRIKTSLITKNLILGEV